ncbi:hypothetical protein [Microbispora sp. H10885]|uniref:hypothetical protein n=1 Tax=Microbispora sp. H10885 TaxID=2729110 RepID=UPI00160158C3|nr:hypothetical protein [Microbispora sp. H10885]
MHRKSGQLALSAIIAATFTAGGVALASGAASAATISPQERVPGGSARSLAYTTVLEPSLSTVAEVPAISTIAVPELPATLAAMPQAISTSTLPAGIPMSEIPMSEIPMAAPIVAARPSSLSITVREQFPSSSFSREWRGSSLSGLSSMGGLSGTMEQARADINAEAGSAMQRIRDEAASAQKRIEQLASDAMAQLPSESSSLPSSPESSLESSQESSVESSVESSTSGESSLGTESEASSSSSSCQ